MIELRIRQYKSPKTGIYNLFEIKSLLKVYESNPIDLFFIRFHLTPSSEVKNQMKNAVAVIYHFDYTLLSKVPKNIILQNIDSYCYRKNFTIQSLFDELRDIIYGNRIPKGMIFIISEKDFLNLLFDMSEVLNEEENKEDYETLKKFIYDPKLLYALLN